MGHLMTALGAKVERVIINDLKNATYYARMIIRAENELQQKKIIELDGRPSDCIAMATQQKAPMYVSQEVWDEVDDMSDVLRKMEEDGLKPDIESESSPNRNRPRKIDVTAAASSAQTVKRHSGYKGYNAKARQAAQRCLSLSTLMFTLSTVSAFTPATPRNAPAPSRCSGARSPSGVSSSITSSTSF